MLLHLGTENSIPFQIISQHLHVKIQIMQICHMECNLYGTSYAYLNKLKAEHNTEAPTTLRIGDSIKLQVMTMNHVAYTIILQAHKEIQKETSQV